jgi:acyl CoA:acetate/3-ketoacid CoA transferase beta subunit
VPAALEGCLPEEFLAFQISREVRDFERTAVGTLSPVPLLGVLHARARHAAHGKFLFFGSEATPVTDGSKELFDMAQRGKLDLFFLSGAQIDRGGPTKLITPLCTMEYENDAGEWRLSTLHPGVSYEEARRETGFPLMPEKVPDTPSPSPADVALIRAQIPALRISYPVFTEELAQKIE